MAEEKAFPDGVDAQAASIFVAWSITKIAMVYWEPPEGITPEQVLEIYIGHFRTAFEGVSIQSGKLKLKSE